jgi:hypothetical protein
MADDSTVDVDRLPTLTEVLELGHERAAGSPATNANARTNTDTDSVSDSDSDKIAVTDTDLVAQVLALLEPRIGHLLEARLREALAPALARAADGLIRDVRAELAPTLRGLVEEAVAQAQRQPRLPQ